MNGALNSNWRSETHKMKMQSQQLQEPQIANDATLFAKVSPTRHANETSVLHRRDTVLAGQDQPHTSINRTMAPGQRALGSSRVAVFATILYSTLLEQKSRG